MKKIVILRFRASMLFVGITLVGGVLYGQQEGQYTQYIVSGLNYNPAVAGNTGVLSMTAIHREQWVGMTGRPRSTMFSAHTPLRYESVGVGLTVDNHAVGPLNDAYISANASYSLRLDQTTHFSFGLKLGMDLLSFDRDILSTSSGVPHKSANARSTLNPNVGAGIMWQGEHFLFGLSVPRLLRQKYYKKNVIEDLENLQRHHYYLTASYMIDLGTDWQLRPSTHLKITKGAPLSADISATAIYQERVWLGAFYQVKSAVGAIVQVQVVDSFKVGVAGGFSTTMLDKASLEVMLAYDIDALHVHRQIRPRAF